MTFSEIVPEIIKGRKFRRASWPRPGSFYAAPFISNRADYAADDWELEPEPGVEVEPEYKPPATDTGRTKDVWCNAYDCGHRQGWDDHKHAIKEAREKAMKGEA
jgi:hypothetical protein